LLTSVAASAAQSYVRTTADLSPQTDRELREAIEQGRKLAEELAKRESLPGFSVAVAVDGKTVWSEGFGLADLENKVAVSPRTRFRVGSISKLLTAAGLARLYEQGLVDLEAPVQRYVPTFPRT